MQCKINYHSDRRYNKPWRVEAVLVDDMGEEFAVIEVHGRWKDTREASEVGKAIGVRFDGFSESWGDMQFSDVPPAIETIGD